MYLKELEFRQGFTEIAVNGAPVRTRYAEAGAVSNVAGRAAPEDKPHVVLLHGTGGHWETFAPNLAALSEHFHCVAIDMIGNGFSGQARLRLRDRGLRRACARRGWTTSACSGAHFIGMSLGAWVASTIAVKHPSGSRR